ncbi:alpha/beta hydrolase family protein [Microbacterium sp. P06]|uniref:alpha/beta hydrolase family protein n=1 Tax=Microbacterium sp. P06 TaxID=3366949 RepID=UPI003744C178
MTAPTVGTDLPVIVFAHGYHQSMSSYDPLVDHWATHGFVVVQPTFLDAAALGLTPADPRFSNIWRLRVEDVTRVIDDLARIVSEVPGLEGRVDLDRLAVAGHSWGGQSVGMHLGARVVQADGRPGPSVLDPRVRAGVLLAATGIGGPDLTPFAQEHFAFMSPDFDELTTPTLVVAGDHDQSQLSTRGPDWFTDVYRLSPGARALVTLFGGEHSLGGIHGYNQTDTTDEDPARVDVVRRASTAFLMSELGVDIGAWDAIVAAALDGARIDVK